MNREIILASASPRRKQLLEQIGFSPLCLPVNIDETQNPNETPLEYCQRLALEKAQKGWKESNHQIPVLGSDTIVVLGNKTLGKPNDSEDAFKTLSQLSNNTHQVMTSVAIVEKDKSEICTSISKVTFNKLTKNDILKYIQTKEPFDKAGSYAIQGLASIWIKNIQGSYSGIMGLPLYETASLLKKFNIEVL